GRTRLGIPLLLRRPAAAGALRPQLCGALLHRGELRLAEAAALPALLPSHVLILPLRDRRREHASPPTVTPAAAHPLARRLPLWLIRSIGSAAGPPRRRCPRARPSPHRPAHVRRAGDHRGHRRGPGLLPL